MNELEQVPELIEKALDISQEIELQSEEGVSLKVLGIYYKSKNDWEQSLANFDKAKELLASTEDTSLAETYYECGMMFKAKGETDQAKVEIETALRMFEEMDKKLWEEKCLKALGEL